MPLPPTDPPPTMRAILYLRVSTKEQAEMGGDPEGYSIPAQREACQRKAASLGAVVVEEFVDRGESARSANRPELQRLLTYVREHSVDYIVVHKVDRLARSRADDVTINLALQAAGVSLVSVTENIDETPSGLLLHGIMSSIAEFYSRNLANEVIKGSVQKAKAGGTVGKAPTGYRNVRKMIEGREVRTVEIDPERGPLMRWAFEQYATGDWTMRSLHAALTEKGLTSTGGPRTPSKPLSLSNFARLLRTSYYMGIVSYRGVEYAGAHEPLVSVDTFERVQAVLDSHNRAGEKQRTHRHYLKGSVFCGRCHSRLCVMHAKNRHGTVYPYFFCLGRQQHYTDCTQKVILIEQVEDAVIRHYATVQLSAQQQREVRTFILEQLQSRRTAAADEQARQERRIRQLNDERGKLLQAHYAGAIPLELLKAEQDRISSELRSAEQLLHASRLSTSQVETRLEQALELVGNCQAAYQAASSQVRRWMNQTFFERLEITEEYEVSSDLAAPFKLLLHGDVQRAAEQHEREQREGHTYCRRSHPVWGSPIPASKEPTPAFAGLGSREDYLVGAEGLEPPTPSL